MATKNVFLGMGIFFFSTVALAKEQVFFNHDHTTNWPPFAFSEKEKIGGLFDGIIGMAVMKFNYELKYVDTTAEKSAHGGNDAILQEKEKVRCGGSMSPSWMANKDDYLWTGPIVESRDELWFLKGKKKEGKDFSDFKNLKVGACKGYNYPTIQEFFEKKTWLRTDYERTEKLGCEQVALEALKKGEVDAVVSNRHVLGYLIKQKIFTLKDFENFSKPIEIMNLHAFCNKIKKSEEFVLKLDAIFQNMKKEKLIDNIVLKYSALK